MLTIQWIQDFLDRLAPPQLAAEWDNVGLLVGDPHQTVLKVMTCLTLTPETVAEAVEAQVNLVVTHHPLPFHPLKQITTTSLPGGMLWRLAAAGVAVYSPHTAFDSCRQGINQQIAERLGLVDIQPLEKSPLVADGGVGRRGVFPRALAPKEIVEVIRGGFPGRQPIALSSREGTYRSVGIVCGAGGSLLPLAAAAEVDVLLTGEASFHNVLEARARGILLIQVGHFESERFAVEWLAEELGKQFGGLEVWAASSEVSPLTWM